ncbi:MAG: hypothetical protein RIC03_12585 [Cyclobacteriaceae bacterium]
MKNYQVTYQLSNVDPQKLSSLLWELEEVTGMKPHCLVENSDIKPTSFKFIDEMSQTTIQAFKELVNERGIAKELDINPNTLRSYRKMVNDNPDDPTLWKISINKMEELLEAGGYTVVQEKLWKNT